MRVALGYYIVVMLSDVPYLRNYICLSASPKPTTPHLAWGTALGLESSLDREFRSRSSVVQSLRPVLRPRH